MFSVACFIQASSLLTTFFSNITLRESWLAVVIGAVLFLPPLWLYRTLMVMFPDRTLLQVLEDVFGAVAGKILGAVYVWLAFTVTSLNLIDIGNFTKLTIMPQTPNVVLVLVCALVCAFGIWHGIKLVTRYSLFFVVIAFLILGASIVLVLDQVNLQNFVPVFDLPVLKYVQSAHIVAAVPFGELVLVLMITPNVQLSRHDTTKYLFWGFAMGAITILLVMLRDIAVLGNTLELFTLPGLITLRLVNMGTALSRMEILFEIVLIVQLFFKTMLLYYISVVALAQLLKVKSYRRLILIAGVFIIVYGFTLYPGPVEHVKSVQETVPFSFAILEFVVPFIVYVVAKCRKLPKEKEVS
jgi:spore germination protein KB